jgi:hypothetical protein
MRLGAFLAKLPLQLLRGELQAFGTTVLSVSISAGLFCRPLKQENLIARFAELVLQSRILVLRIFQFSTRRC